MATDTMTWRKSATYALSTSDVAGCLAGLKAAVDAEVAANPSTYIFQVADYSAGNGTLVLKDKNSGTRRLMLFGGSSPNSAAIDSMTATTTSLYAGTAPTAGVDAPQQAYTSGAPFTTGEWLPAGLILSTYTNITRVTYFEHTDGMVILFHGTTLGAANLLSSAILGGHMVSNDDENVIDVAIGSAGFWSSAWLSTGSASSNPISADLGYSTTDARLYLLDGSSLAAKGARISGFMNVDNNNSLKESTRRYFPNILIKLQSSDTLRGRMRQIAYCVNSTFLDEFAEAGGGGSTIAYCLSPRDDTPEDSLWLTNFKV